MGAYLNTPKTTKTTTTGQNSTLEYAASEMQGWRISMEDAKLANINFDTSSALFGVFDGHGGKEVAIFVERHFCHELLSNSNYQQGNYEAALAETFLQMDVLLKTPNGQKEILRIMRDLPDNADIAQTESDSFAGCTSVVSLIKGNKLYVANAGDSRCVLARGGRAIEMTQDHKPDLPSERDRIISAGGSVEDGRVMGNLNLSRSIGDLEYKRNPNLSPQQQMITAMPEMREFTLDSECDFMILACDGIWDVLTSQECVDFVYQRKDSQELTQVVEAILDRCLAPDVTSMGGLGCDNMTCVVVKFKDWQLDQMEDFWSQAQRVINIVKGLSKQKGDFEWLRSWLKGFDFFSEIQSKRVLDQCIKMMRYVQYSSGDVIVGIESQVMIVLSGLVEVVYEGGFVWKYWNGDTIKGQQGYKGLSVTDTELVLLDYEHYQKSVRFFQLQRRFKIVRILQKIPGMVNVEEERLLYISAYPIKMVLKSKERLFRQNQPAESMFVIAEGEFKLLQTISFMHKPKAFTFQPNMKTYQQQIAILSQYEIIGSSDIDKNKNYSYTCQCISDTGKVYQIKKQEYLTHFKPLIQKASQIRVQLHKKFEQRNVQILKTINNSPQLKKSNTIRIINPQRQRKTIESPIPQFTSNPYQQINLQKFRHVYSYLKSERNSKNNSIEDLRRSFNQSHHRTSSNLPDVSRYSNFLAPQDNIPGFSLIPMNGLPVYKARKHFQTKRTASTQFFSKNLVIN